MKYLFSAFCVLIVILLSACQGTCQPAATPTPAPQWENFHSDEGGFSVLFPATPDKSVWSNDTSYGGIYTSTYQDMTYNAIFTIMAANQLSSDQVLQSLRDNQAADLKARVLSSDPIDFNGYPGLAYSLDAPKSKALPDGGVVQGRIYHINDHVYIVYQIGPKKNSLLPDIKKFLGSLKVDGMVVQSTAVPMEAGTTAVPEGWKEFTSQQDGFSVWLPGTPKRQVVSSDKKMEVTTQLVQSGLDMYGVMSFNFKDPTLLQGRTDPLFTLTKDSLLKNMGGTVVSEKSIQLGPYAGQEFLVNLPKSKNQPTEGQMLVRLYLANKHMYGVIAVTVGKDVPPEATQFLDSFQVLEPK